jgi:phenylalanyl-tRNA synthetase beta subunit
VQDKTERWFHLCQQAAVEQNPDKLLALIAEINDILEY